MSTTPDVSVILPALLPNNEYLRCLHSIRTAFSGRINFEIICVVRDTKAFAGLSAPDLRIVQEEAPGIYGAMNKGVIEATGRYLYFIGQDDILLPSAASAVIQGMSCDADVVLADVFWGVGRRYKNNPSRRSLVWKNWCHQGILYDRLMFLDVIGAYPLAYKAQADHYINIVISGIPGLKWTKHNGCIAWYSSDGFSTRVKDMEFRKAFPEIVRQHFGVVSFVIVVIRRALLIVFRQARKAN